MLSPHQRLQQLHWHCQQAKNHFQSLHSMCIDKLPFLQIQNEDILQQLDDLNFMQYCIETMYWLIIHVIQPTQAVSEYIYTKKQEQLQIQMQEYELHAKTTEDHLKEIKKLRLQKLQQAGQIENNLKKAQTKLNQLQDQKDQAQIKLQQLQNQKQGNMTNHTTIVQPFTSTPFYTPICDKKRALQTSKNPTTNKYPRISR